MESQQTEIDFGEAVRVTEAPAAPWLLVVCEHASNRIPRGLNGLGVSDAVRRSHVAWDPGALGVAERLAARLGAALVVGTVSRLVYDCNRPPEAPSAIPARSEIHDIPGNAGLDDAARAQRVAGVYEPFRAALAAQIARHRASLALIVTVHSFTPVFNGVPRAVELGILHGADDDFARWMMASAPQRSGHDIRLNEPYSAVDGVAHTLDLHGAANGLPSVMIEIRNDLIANPSDETRMAGLLADWIDRTVRERRQAEAAR